MRDNSVDDTKYRMSSAPQFHPAATASVPMIVAATAPPRDSERARRAASEMHAAASTNPNSGALDHRSLPCRGFSATASFAHCLPLTHPTQMLATVDALLPLSLLEAVRNVDTPSDQLDAEYVDELRNKRLGLSDTIYAQIKRHSEAVEAGTAHRAGRIRRAREAHRPPARRRSGVSRRGPLHGAASRIARSRR